MALDTEFVIETARLGSDREIVGPKTAALKKLIDSGVPVPPFIAVPANRLPLLWPAAGGVSPGALKRLIPEVRTKLRSVRYAVRSSALSEDSATESNAGVFLSFIDIAGERIGPAVTEILMHACRERRLTSDKFSLLIQEYVRADFSGVLFTRDPFGGRQMIVEFAEGPCTAIVSGEVVPERFERFHGDEGTQFHGLDFTELLRLAERIEELFGFPQDIEWCARDGKFWILQSRPITNLSAAQYAGMKHLDAALKGRPPCRFEKTGVSETVPRPCPLSLSLVKRLYAAGGPVDQVYRKFRLEYRPTDFLTLFGNELFSDAAEERRMLLPAAKLEWSGRFGLAWSVPQDLLQTAKNFVLLKLLPAPDEAALRTAITGRLAAWPKPECSFAEAVNDLLQDYGLIFETNLFAGLAVARVFAAAKYVAKGEPISLAEVLASAELEDMGAAPTEALTGNSLDLEDESPFLVETKAENQSHRSSPLEGWKREYVAPKLQAASKLIALREMGRWLTVRHTNRIRDAAFREARKAGLENPKDILFLSVDECLKNEISVERIDERKQERLRLAEFAFPQQVGNVPLRREAGGPIGVSGGQATGILVTESQLEAPPAGEKLILYTRVLSPHFAPLLPQLSGIVAEQGGMLSHLAILARERGIPVVVRAERNDKQLPPGATVTIDGSTGSIVLGHGEQEERVTPSPR